MRYNHPPLPLVMVAIVLVFLVGLGLGVHQVGPTIAKTVTKTTYATTTISILSEETQCKAQGGDFTLEPHGRFEELTSGEVVYQSPMTMVLDCTIPPKTVFTKQFEIDY